jgi:hypothetical protein
MEGGIVNLRWRKYYVFFCLLLVLAGCTSPQIAQRDIGVTIIADGHTQQLKVPVGSTASDALEKAGITVNLLDRSEPPLYTVLAEGDEIHLTRVVEEFEVEESIIPYETQTLRNESLPEGEQRLVQPGVNGTMETTYRIVYEDGMEVSRSAVKTNTILEAVPEIVMVGSQAPVAAAPVNGVLAYLSAGNAWIIEESSGNRRPVITSGDLDGRIFRLSPNGEWLLFSRSSQEEGIINSLMVARVSDGSGLEVDLRINNVINYADWVPGSARGLAFSTVEPNPNPPGWQANNDLQFVNFSESSWASEPRPLIHPSSGGIYGWWGTTFLYSPDGEEMLYVRPDGVGIVDFERNGLTPLADVVPLQTRSDWAWVPEVDWSPDQRYIFMVSHAPQVGVTSPEESPLFDLVAVPTGAGTQVTLVKGAGMFAQPAVSPVKEMPSGERAYQVAYLQALIPTQSRTSGYRLWIMDRDGSNQKAVFPPEGAQGLDPQRYAWSPPEEDSTNGLSIALIYQGNLWLVDVNSGQAQQLTGDGLTTALEWK